MKLETVDSAALLASLSLEMLQGAVRCLEHLCLMISTSEKLLSLLEDGREGVL